jgi:toxin ParE1/3/4
VAWIRQTQLARADLLDIWLTIAIDNPQAADRVYERLERRMATLAQFPLIGVAQPAIASNARMLVERPYLILYQVTSDGVQIVRVLHGARDVDATLFAAGIEPIAW